MPETASTSLEDIETKPITAPFRSYREFLDEKSPGAALASTRFYRKMDPWGTTKFSDRLSDCRSRAWFIRNSETGKVRVAAKQCRLRWCYHCSEARQQFITAAVLPWLERAHNPLLLTVTMKHRDKPLSEQIDFLYKSFTKLRNRLYIKEKCRGGVWFFQVTYNQKIKQWHPHIHALIDSKYLRHDWLTETWYKITRCSQIVHIRAIHDREKTLSHNARYAARPSALIKIPEELWPDMYEAFDGRRICGSWGTAKAISLRPVKPEDASKWVSIGGFRLVSECVKSDDNASAIWRAWLMDLKLPPDVNMNDIEIQLGYRFEERPPPEKSDQQLRFTYPKRESN